MIDWVLLIKRIHFFLFAPTIVPEMIWILFPMLITLLLMTIYFGRYRKEELGWNTAVSNALVLIFVGVDLLKTIYTDLNPLRALLVFLRTLFLWDAKTLMASVAALLIAYGVMLFLMDFFHILPKKFAFFISSSLPINILAYFGIVVVYTKVNGLDLVPFDWYTFSALIILFILLYAFLSLIKWLVPHNDLATLVDKTPSPKDVVKKIISKPSSITNISSNKSFSDTSEIKSPTIRMMSPKINQSTDQTLNNIQNNND